EVTDQIDKQTWDRTIRSVNKEIVSDYKNAAFYEISKTPGNTSNDKYSKFSMYEQVAEFCEANGDEDGALQAKTASNNAKEAYINALEKEAKDNDTAAKKAFAEELSDAKVMLNSRLNEINDPTNLKYVNNPGAKAFAIASVNASLARNEARYATVIDNYDPDAALTATDKAQDAYNKVVDALAPYNVDMSTIEASINDFSSTGEIDIPGVGAYDGSGNLYPELKDGYYYTVDQNTGKMTTAQGDTTGMAMEISGGLVIYQGTPKSAEDTFIQKSGQKYFNPITNAWQEFAPTISAEKKDESFQVDSDGKLRYIDFQEGNPNPVLGAYVDPRDFYAVAKDKINTLRLDWYIKNGILPQTATLDDVYSVPTDKKLNFDWNSRQFIINPNYPNAELPGENIQDQRTLSVLGDLNSEKTLKSMEKISEKIQNETNLTTREKLHLAIADSIGNKVGAISPAQVIRSEIENSKLGKMEKNFSNGKIGGNLKKFSEGITGVTTLKKLAKAAQPAASKALEEVKEIPRALSSVSPQKVFNTIKATPQKAVNMVKNVITPAPIPSVYGNKSYGEFLGKGSNGLAYFKKTKGVNSYDYFSSAYGSKVYNPVNNTEAQKYTGKS
ncbi:MAG: hypothetical protein M0R80_27305, partial [Proteobacteria bacterium]|nr:hypothetical protein [Pseudomonadota bacterium]